MISIIIPVYNGGQYIEKALQSIFSQTVATDKYEIIVINDGSTDNTQSILGRYNGKIKSFLQPNQGLVGSCNRAIKESNGDYVIRLDADDYFDKNILASTLEVLEANPQYDCVYTDRYEIKAVDNTTARVNTGKDNIFNMIACGMLFRKEVFAKIGSYRSLLFEEYDLMLRFYAAGLRAYYLQQPLYNYLRHESSMTNQDGYWRKGWKQLSPLHSENQLNAHLSIQTKHLPVVGQD